MHGYSLNDHDRGTLVIQFLKRYGYCIGLLIALCVLGIGVNMYWKNHINVRNGAASNAYQALLMSIQNGAKPQAISAAATQIIQDYPHTLYARFAQLQLARLAIANNDLGGAEQALQQSLKAAPRDSFSPIIHLRLARVLLAENKATDVLDVLGSTPRGFESAYGLLRGDAEMQLKQFSRAQATYQHALDAAHRDPLFVQLLNERLNNLSAQS